MILALAVPATVLGLFKSYSWPLAAISTLAISFAQSRETTGALQILTDRIRPLSIPFKLSLGLLGIILSLRCALALSFPPFEGDSLIYHLPISVAFLKQHGFIPARLLYFPGLSELMESAGIGALGAFGGQAAVEAFVTAAFFLAVYGFTREYGGNRESAFLAAIAALSIPVLQNFLFTSRNDVLVCALMVTGCALWKKQPRFCAAAFGLALATKYTSLVLGFCMCLILLMFRGWPFTVTDVVLGLGLALPWYARNYLELHAPVVSGSFEAPVTVFQSTIAGSFLRVWKSCLSGLFRYGSFLSILGMIVSLISPMLKKAAPLRRPPAIVAALGLATLTGWCFLPNAVGLAPVTPGNYWPWGSLKYGYAFQVFFIAAASVSLSRARRGKLLGYFALAASLAACIRTVSDIHHIDPQAVIYAIPLFILLAAGIAWVCGAYKPIRPPLVGACAAALVFSMTAVFGSKSIDAKWDSKLASAAGWNSKDNFLKNPSLKSARRVAVIDTAPLPFIGSRMQRTVVVNQSFLAPRDWVNSLSSRGVDLVVAGSIFNPLIPVMDSISPEEKAIIRSGKYRLVHEEPQLRAYRPL